MVDKVVKPQYNTHMKTKYFVYEETTDWGDNASANHVYIFTDKPSGRTAKAVGYVKVGSKTVERWKTPYTIDLRGRTFKELV